MQFITILGDDAISMIEGTRHKTARARLMPAFLPSIVASFHNVITDHAREFFNSLAKNISATSSPVNVVNPVKNYFVDLIIKFTINTGLHDGDTAPEQYDNHHATFGEFGSVFIQFATGLTSPPFLPAYKRGLRASATLEEKLSLILLRRLRDRDTRAKLRQTRECLDSDKIAKVLSDGRADLMSILIATSLKLPDNDDAECAIFNSEESVAEVRSLARSLRVLWFAGYTTQSSSLLCLIMEVFSDSTLLKQLQDEQNAVPELTAQSVANDMPLLSSVVTESMRINPALTMMFRRTTEDVVVLKHHIPKGTAVALDYCSANVDEAIFQNADDFIADRFVDNPELVRKVLAFGAVGSTHYCIGASMAMTVLKTTLAVMLREFDVDVKPWKRRSIKHLPDTQPRDGVWIRDCAPKRGL